MADIKQIKIENITYDIHAKTADIASQLGTNAGSSTQPIYFLNGIPTNTTYKLEKSVPSNAVFTDTTYSAATTSANGLMSSTDKSKLDGIAAGANKTIVDSALSSSSINPVQNKVVNTELAKKANKPTVVTGTLSAGSTSITLTNNAITTDSVIDIYTSVYGVNPINVTDSNGSITLTFDAQSSNVTIRVEVR